MNSYFCGNSIAGRHFDFLPPKLLHFIFEKTMSSTSIKQWRTNLYKHFYELFEIIYFYHIFIGHISWNERGSFGVVFRLQRAQFNARPSL